MPLLSPPNTLGSLRERAMGWWWGHWWRPYIGRESWYSIVRNSKSYATPEKKVRKSKREITFWTVGFRTSISGQFQVNFRSILGSNIGLVRPSGPSARLNRPYHTFPGLSRPNLIPNATNTGVLKSRRICDETGDCLSGNITKVF